MITKIIMTLELPFNVDGSGFILSSSSNKSSGFIISSSSLSIVHTAATAAGLLVVLANDSLADEPTSYLGFSLTKSVK